MKSVVCFLNYVFRTLHQNVRQACARVCVWVRCFRDLAVRAKPRREEIGFLHGAPILAQIFGGFQRFYLTHCYCGKLCIFSANAPRSVLGTSWPGMLILNGPPHRGHDRCVCDGGSE